MSAAAPEGNVPRGGSVTKNTKKHPAPPGLERGPDAGNHHIFFIDFHGSGCERVCSCPILWSRFLLVLERKLYVRNGRAKEKRLSGKWYGNDRNKGDLEYRLNLQQKILTARRKIQEK
ncbi:hypothetical protein [Methanoregula sp.]|uniref:hypothetical protein n=1 Tax=Methanoregula sp. TaxID=2052170 RepID=UPI003BAF6B45